MIFSHVSRQLGHRLLMRRTQQEPLACAVLEAEKLSELRVSRQEDGRVVTVLTSWPALSKRPLAYHRFWLARAES